MASADAASRTSVHRLYQAEMAPEISPEEALGAEQTFRTGLRLLAGVAAGWLALVLGAAYLKEINPAAAEAVSDVAGALLLLSALVLVTLYRVPFAGRLLLPFGVVEGFMRVEDFWGESLTFLLIPLAGVLFYFLGKAIDSGVSPDQRLAFPRRSFRLRLVAAGVLALIQLLSWLADTSGWLPAAGLLACTVLALWPRWPGPWIEKRRPVLEPDSETVLRAAGQRWLSHLGGILLAFLFGAFPLFLFLNNLDVQEKLAPGGHRVETGIGSERVLWYWPTAPGKGEGRPMEGRFLGRGDLAQARIYDQARLPEDLRNRITNAGPLDGAGLSELLGELESYRLSSEALLQKAAEAPEGLQISELMSGDASGGTVVYLRESALLPASRPLLEQLRQPAWRYLVNAFLALGGLLGFLILWRRGGDSPVARWLALCLVGWAVVVAGPYAELYLPTVLWNLWQAALESPLAGLALMLIELPRQATQVTGALGLLPFAFLWMHLCWPASPRGDRSRWGHFLRRTLRVAAVFLSVVAVIFVFFVVLEMAPKSHGMVTAVFSVLLALLAVGWGVRRRRRTAGATELPLLGRLPVAAFLCLQGAVTCGLPLGTDTSVGSAVGWLGLAFLVAFAALAGFLILRRDFLRLTAGWSQGRGLLLLLLPFLSHASEAVAGALLQQTSFFSEKGQTVLEMLLVVIVLGPLDDVLARVVPLLTIPRLRSVERAVDQALESLADAQDDVEVRQAAAGAFQDLEVGEYLLYGRRDKGVFRLLTGEAGPAPAQEVVLSGRLREHLAGWDGRIVDLAVVAYQLTHFFQQFELRRLEEDTGCRYLMPVCLGKSLRAFVLLPGTLGSHVICRDVSGLELSKLGVAAAEAGRFKAEARVA